MCQYLIVVMYAGNVALNQETAWLISWYFMTEFMKTDAKFLSNIKNYYIWNGADNAVEYVIYNLCNPFASQKRDVALTHTCVRRGVSKYAWWMSDVSITVLQLLLTFHCSTRLRSVLITRVGNCHSTYFRYKTSPLRGLEIKHRVDTVSQTISTAPLWQPETSSAIA